MADEKLTFTETVTKTYSAEGETNARHLQALMDRRGVPTGPIDKPPSTERPEAPEGGTRESAAPQVPKKPSDAQVKTPTTVADESGDTSAPDALPTPGELLGKLARKIGDDVRGTASMIGEDVRSLVDKALAGPEDAREQDRAPKEPEDHQPG